MPLFSQATFTAAAGTLVAAAYSPDLGAAFVVQSGADAVISNAGRFRGQNAAGAGESWYRKPDTPPSADYTVRASIYHATGFTGGGGAECGILARLSSGAMTGYLAGYEVNAARWVLYRVSTGTFSLLGSFSQSLTNGVAYALELRCYNALKEVWIDGVQRITSSNNEVTAAGFPGIRNHNGGAAFASDTTGMHVDNFEAEFVPVILTVGGVRHAAAFM